MTDSSEARDKIGEEEPNLIPPDWFTLRLSRQITRLENQVYMLEQQVSILQERALQEVKR